MPEIFVEVRLDAAATAGALTVLDVTIPSGASAGFHRHTLEDETILVREGELVVVLDAGEETVRAGGHAFLARGVRHAFRNEDARATRAFFVCTPAGLEEFFRARERGEDGAAAAARAGLELG